MPRSGCSAGVSVCFELPPVLSEQTLCTGTAVAIDSGIDDVNMPSDLISTGVGECAVANELNGLVLERSMGFAVALVVACCKLNIIPELLGVLSVIIAATDDTVAIGKVPSGPDLVKKFGSCVAARLLCRREGRPPGLNSILSSKPRTDAFDLFLRLLFGDVSTAAPPLATRSVPHGDATRRGGARCSGFMLIDLELSPAIFVLHFASAKAT